MESSREKRSERVYQKIKESTEKIKNFNKDLLNLTTETIAMQTGIARSNVSKELNKLFSFDKLVKIAGKPVIYLDREIFEAKIKKSLKKNLYFSIQELEEEINKAKSLNDKEPEETKSVLDTIIGAQDSLKDQISQGKAAILYPPDGLHMLISGETGVGKSTFAEAMHRYAVEVKKLSQESPFIIFNCADYSGNPQLLLSQLFGHVKGAFSGADKDKKGLVELANGGILFLDEIHRLPPEGQEMMFLLMDKGIFRKLGESESFHKSKVLIIGATTEDPHSAMLSTFLRRIPSIIKLPPLRERTIDNRINLIYNFFHGEFFRVKVPIKVSNEVIKVLAIYDCPGNVGQLRSDIQLICARGFLEYMSEGKDCIEIKLSQLSESIIKGYFNVTNKRNEMPSFVNLKSSGSMCFGTDELKYSDYIKDIFVDNKKTEYNENVYEIIQNQFLNLSSSELSSKEIKSEIDSQIEKYFHGLFSKINPVQNTVNQEAASTIINPKISTIVEETLEELKDEIDGTLNIKIKYALALHINTLIERIQIGAVISNPNKNEIKNQHPVEYKVAEKLKQRLQERLAINIPDDETAFLAMFIYAIKSKGKGGNVGVLIITHGETTAKSMADVANKLLAVEQAHAINMPLEEKIENVLEKAINEVKKIDRGKGVLLLVDMGSLTSFADIITERTKINTRCISMVNTLMVIEATRKSILPSISLDELYYDVKKLVPDSNVNNYNISIKLKNFNVERSLINILEETLNFLNVVKACNLLLKVLNGIVADIGQEMDDNIKTKFLFHCCCMIERVIRGDAFTNKSTNEVIIYKESKFNLIKKHFMCIEESFGIDIPDTEIAYILDIFDTHYDTHVDTHDDTHPSELFSFDTD